MKRSIIRKRTDYSNYDTSFDLTFVNDEDYFNAQSLAGNLITRTIFNKANTIEQDFAISFSSTVEKLRGSHCDLSRNYGLLFDEEQYKCLLSSLKQKLVSNAASQDLNLDCLIYEDGSEISSVTARNYLAENRQDLSTNCATEIVVSSRPPYNDFSMELKACLMDDVFIDGESSQTEIYLSKEISNLGSEQTMNLLMTFFKEAYSNAHFVCGILHTLAHLSYEAIAPAGEFMAMAAFQHKDIEAREFSLKAFDSWASKESLKFLEHIHCDLPWMQEYVDEIITNIKES